MTTKRVSLSKRTRFEIFKRDGFRCAYCGADPTQRALHVDHVIPLAEGGTDDDANLITSCADCNLGKSAVPLEERRFDKRELDAEAAQEHAEQIKAYLSAQRELVDAREMALDEIEAYWCEQFDSKNMVPTQLRGHARRAIADLGIEATLEAIAITASYVAHKSITTQIKYFCGVLRKRRMFARYTPEARALLQRAEKLGYRDVRIEDAEDGKIRITWRGAKNTMPDDLSGALFSHADALRRGQSD